MQIDQQEFNRWIGSVTAKLDHIEREIRDLKTGAVGRVELEALRDRVRMVELEMNSLRSRHDRDIEAQRQELDTKEERLRARLWQVAGLSAGGGGAAAVLVRLLVDALLR